MQTDLSDSSFFNHQSVMTYEIMASLEHYPLINNNQLKGIDATLGGGGHSYHLLRKYSDLNIIGLDQDPFARKSASKKLDEFKNRIDIRASNFADFVPKEKVSFVIADLGVNSNQIDDPKRGFSFQKNGPLDMRMNPFLDVDAEKLIEALNEKDLANLIYKYGEERLSRKIARKIKLDLKENGKYSGTKELAYSIAGCFPPKQRYKKIHPATRTFQALRIAVNKEIEVLEKFLQVVPEWLLPGGIISIISFHSLEDRLVKSCFKNDQRLKNLTKKPITPSEQEVELNKRARSGKLRIAQLN
ncbi:16S rRNA (cytosine(1402)-N(4))-methyltransferase RsmH [Prochlorococcus marinus str. XMU1401]|jgi:16S rRNA (cytosine1402-N4)-methyltransferase|uniref:Ribosomal RNA small subunit methyltransferase H n=1 Tax=Prochlorococcus marinus str. XMU1401 TaxID=2052594 RepID=A0A8I1X3P5_PROMR|nr:MULTISPECIES: 16S rRNA (cytosine(1402)-N(4))-methyltransferase RsmH [Prochlorococcus]MBO6990007.1 16S rRNA (cytosine(1402)-N(4))-methyltransferase RsmH [Prochlorococcus marinus XMU1421]MBO7012574.1 16S rRNA (cytosine(1402)-N(4))-methyltransferase RsmH [Prochlorococcus marinus XMU1422]MCQ9198306.1 16S rRNA (cytosine(1402)-N(4))-methyltransferase RsmH [Prochlorococcus marinus XMU1429]MCR8541605.1 16S rRNA (cytosine(1402)-N(4))-methyltransferase RsmH [Prochlorococcus marinus XMU1423]MDA9721630